MIYVQNIFHEKLVRKNVGMELLIMGKNVMRGRIIQMFHEGNVLQNAKKINVEMEFVIREENNVLLVQVIVEVVLEHVVIISLKSMNNAI